MFIPTVSIVIGVPTIKRERESYLIQTLTSLIDSLNDDEKRDCLIVVFVGEVTVVVITCTHGSHMMNVSKSNVVMEISWNLKSLQNVMEFCD